MFSSRDLFATVAPPVKRLRAFEQVELAPGGDQDRHLRHPRD